ncbi:glycoside hydrolase family 3 N-terminal domain-containing protein [Pontixanthobacter sp.]|uniref:glycoside hydrolase family 3 protein n=1 Tax=Pontixanthobacter sp. TaxID=2792078 RepID=UPI003C7ACE52
MNRSFCVMTNGLASLALASCTPIAGSTAPSSAVGAPASNAVSSEDAQIDALLTKMTLERKIAQLIQPQINSFSVEDMRRYRFGSYLNGGNGGPYGDEFAPASEWLRYADEMYLASVEPLPNGEPAIPVMWGTDAVHGHTNVPGATIFPHNIALGAAGDADLVRRIGHATATEIKVTGIDWNFSPTIAVARDDRWGRTYESYSENPALVATLGAALVEGLQGRPGDDDFLGETRVIATAKHFFGDGGTEQGVDQGDVNGDIDALLALHGQPYPVAIDAGVASVMASFNSINGRKMHGNRDLLTGVLRGDMGFDGLVVGDWNGHGQVQGCTVSDCPQSLLAGLDIYMVPDDWRGLMETLLEQVRGGTIPVARVDEAVTRILRIKARAGLLGPDSVRPSQRGVAGRYDLLASAEHRALAREAVGRSQVILNNDGTLPLTAGAHVLVAGTAADNIAQAAGGWTLTWQGGGDLDNSYFPQATSIYAGIADLARASGGRAVLSADGSYSAKPDVAVVVFGEQPYAEFAGDLRDLAFRDEEGLTLLRRFQDDGIPTVAVFLSGRPLWVNREINAANAFIASWLPGGEGAGVADILFGKRPATGRLSFSWPATCAGTPVNGGANALFVPGYGRSLDDVSGLRKLDEGCAALASGAGAEWFAAGRLAAGVTVRSGANAFSQMLGTAPRIIIRAIDRNAQEDAREIAFEAGGELELSGSGAAEAYRITYALPQRPEGPVTFISGASTYDAAREIAVAEGKGWREMVLTRDCLPQLTNALRVRSAASLILRVHTIRREELPAGTPCSF